MENFVNLDDNTQDLIKDLLCRMATIDNFRSPKIKYILTGYSYGEIRPMPYRFFFFQKCGNNFVFFGYTLKKKDSLKNELYKNLERDKKIYEEEFRKFVERN